MEARTAFEQTATRHSAHTALADGIILGRRANGAGEGQGPGWGFLGVFGAGLDPAFRPRRRASASKGASTPRAAAFARATPLRSPGRPSQPPGAGDAAPAQPASAPRGAMASDDPRKDYLANIIMDQLVGSSDARRRLAKDADKTKTGLCNGGEMDQFLDQEGDMPLQALLVQNGGQLEIRLSNEVQSVESEAMVCFTKVGTSSITAENVQRMVQVTSAPQKTVDGLYSSLHSVFLPLLKQKGNLDPAVARLLDDLDASLGSMVRGSSGSSVDVQKITGILKIEDEIAFWGEVGKHDNRAHASWRDIISRLSQIDKSLKGEDDDEGLTYESLTAALEVDGRVERALDDMFREEDYPEMRMTHLLKLIGDSVIQFVQSSLAAKDIWRSSFAVAERELNNAIALCECWASSSESLVRGWREIRKWKGDYVDKRMGGLMERLKKLVQLRKTQDALTTLLTRDEQSALRIDQAFQRFGDVRALQVNAYSNVAWEAAMSEYDTAMVPAMDKVFEKLRELFSSELLPGVQAAVQELKEKQSDVGKVSSSAVAHPYQLLNRFSKYKDMLLHPAIAAAKMLQQYVQIISDIAKGLDSVMDTKQAPKNVSGKNLTLIANSLVFTSQLLHKVKQLKESATSLVSDLDEGRVFDEVIHRFAMYACGACLAA